MEDKKENLYIKVVVFVVRWFLELSVEFKKIFLQTRQFTDYEQKIYYTEHNSTPTWYILIRHNGTSNRTYFRWIKGKRG